MNTVSSDLVTRFHHLPHWQQGGSIYFVTFRSIIGELPDEAKKIVIDVLTNREQSRYLLLLAVVMPDHVHALLLPNEITPKHWIDLSTIMKGIKGTTSRRINKELHRSGQVWQRDTFDRIIRNEQELNNKWNYMKMNPVTASLVNDPQEYPYFASHLSDCLYSISTPI